MRSASHIFVLQVHVFLNSVFKDPLPTTFLKSVGHQLANSAGWAWTKRISQKYWEIFREIRDDFLCKYCGINVCFLFVYFQRFIHSFEREREHLGEGGAMRREGRCRGRVRLCRARNLTQRLIPWPQDHDNNRNPKSDA